MLETLKRKLTSSRAYRWLTSYAYEQGFDEGVGVGYKLAERLVSHEATNAERRRTLEILTRERARLLELEELEWKGYSAELLDEVEAIMTLVGREELL
jgi:hypothetical protein